ncbi:MAG: DUF2235 domain-containing protein [Planctomycetes bacterium]|nr:DUF2235 domain-containing protein [Planctomycetota bacterium]
MKRLVVCCDGTWNTASQEENNLPAPTNVVKICNAVADQDAAGNEQVKYYHPGVGTEGSFLARTAGGVFGDGLDKNIKSGWAWIASHYAPGDAVYLFGFSRGAYTARCIGGLVGAFGLPVLEGLESRDAWARIEAAYEIGYSEQKPPSQWRKKDWAWREPGSVRAGSATSVSSTS